MAVPDRSASEDLSFQHAGFRGRIGIASREITPDPGIYCRNWGAATHDVAESVHRPLRLNALVLSSRESDSDLYFFDVDLGWWKTPALAGRILNQILDQLGIRPDQMIFGLTHTHSAPPLMDPDPELPGYEQMQAWIDSIPRVAVEVAREAKEVQFDGILEWAVGRCTLATNRDLVDPDAIKNRVVCGFSPDGPADDTLLVGRISDAQGACRGTLVNYACHPTTLAWSNKAISPDYIGAMRETIENQTHAPALFMLGMCGELAPRYQYVHETTVADAHGRSLGFAALSTLNGMEPAATRLSYRNVMESGAPLAVWQHDSAEIPETLRSREVRAVLPLKDWPSAVELEKQRLECTDRAIQERLRRQREIRLFIGEQNTFSLPFTLWEVGEAIFVGSSCEAYSLMQQELRAQFPEKTLICMNLINGSLGYIPPAGLYDLNVYPVWQTPFDRGCHEAATETMRAALQECVAASTSR